MKKTEKKPSAEEAKNGQNERELPRKMNLDVRVKTIESGGSIKAVASVNFNDCFAVTNIKVVEGGRGLFVSMPSYKAANGDYKDICFPITKEFRQQLQSAVLETYQQVMEQGQEQQSQPASPKQEDALQMDGY